MSHSQSPTTASTDSEQVAGLSHETGWADLLAELPSHDLPPANVSALRARMHQEFELSHARAAERKRRRDLGHFGRLAETAFVASICVVHIAWLVQGVLQH